MAIPNSRTRAIREALAAKTREAPESRASGGPEIPSEEETPQPPLVRGLMQCRPKVRGGFGERHASKQRLNARRLNPFKARLSRAFLANIQSAPAVFWRRIRLLAARELLASRQRGATEIAYETGFSDSAHFCSTFKKHFSMTPKQFRRIGKR
ncbi:helix-turn-helix domain-containing protein [Mesorhizobium sophorae]|uniref:helix-turn-helix domain-containing protein n=1 Tax=Mesorhizobium sophorae TaxID=1300294 RepID=UPI00117F503E|nr:AraC family transcriptional regulator [Mesorhizobium sophorae]